MIGVIQGFDRGYTGGIYDGPSSVVQSSNSVVPIGWTLWRLELDT